jgi:type IX secretion system PorP/SprF family membrane protein
MNVINPAYAGALGKNVFAFTSRRQWSSMQDAPSTLAFSYSSERANNVGLGLSVVSDKVFIEQQTFAYADFSYKLDMESTQLYLGLKAGGNFYSADPRVLSTYSTSSDPAQQQLSRFNPNVGAGAYLRGELFWASFSIPRLFNVKRESDNLAVTAKDRVHSYLGGGADFAVGSGLLLKPSVLFRKVKGLPVTTDITGMLSWQNQFDLGVSYRTSSAFALLAVVSLGGFDIGYAYETPTVSSLSQLNLKTHEIVLRINLGQGDQTDKAGPEPQG